MLVERHSPGLVGDRRLSAGGKSCRSLPLGGCWPCHEQVAKSGDGRRRSLRALNDSPDLSVPTYPNSAGASEDLRIEATLGYAIGWDGHTVTLPPVGDSTDDGLSFTTWDDAYLRFARYAADTFNAGPPEGQTLIPASVVLIPPRPDNEHDPHAVSIARPRSTGVDDRHMGFLYRRLVSYRSRQRDPTSG